MPGSFLDKLVDRWSLYRSIEHDEYLTFRGASESQLDALSVGTVSGKFRQKGGDQERFAKWSHGLKRIQNHVSFPLHNQMGEVAGVLVRDTVEKNYLKWTLSDSRASAYFFGLPAAIEEIWRTRVVWICEGPFDWFVLQRLFPNTLSTTTDALTVQQSVFVRRYAKVVMFALDMDEAGRAGIETSRKRLGRGVRTYSVRFPTKDPSEFWETFGETEFNRHFSKEARAA